MRSQIFAPRSEGQDRTARAATSADRQGVVAKEPSGCGGYVRARVDELTGKLIDMSPRSPVGTIHAVRRNTTIRRVLLRKTNQHVFYSIREADDTVIIRAIWGARRGRPPKLWPT